MPEITQLQEWQALQSHREALQTTHFKEFFAQPVRQSEFSLMQHGILFDYSKNLITRTTIDLLIQLAEARGLRQAISDLFAARFINASEARPVAHHLLRRFNKNPVVIDGTEVMGEILAERERLFQFTHAIRSGQWRGASNKPINTIVNLGIGGSRLGPEMAIEALLPYVDPAMSFHFISNIDSYALDWLLAKLDPTTTVFIVSSKSFTTAETMRNAQRVQQWLTAQLGAPEMCRFHLVAVTAEPKHAIEFGIHPDNIFKLWPWVGGRFSVCSSVGLSLALAIGMASFTEFLRGANDIDQHFAAAPFSQNIPVILALLSIWYTNFHHAATHAMVPYHDGLAKWIAYCQQLHMESNGKSVTRDNLPIHYRTSPIIWGGVGCDVQHSFMQLLYQGTELVPVDFILPCQAIVGAADSQKGLVANCLAQAQALAFGTQQDGQCVSEPLLFENIMGQQPSNILMFAKLTPYILGALIAIYEHKVFAQGIIWDINSFDQWGVQLGKTVADAILKEPSAMRSSTAALYAHYQKMTTGDL